MLRLVRCKHVCRCSRACWEDALFTDVKIKPLIENRTRGVNNVMHRKRVQRIFGIWEKTESWVPASERESRDWELGEARRLCALRAPRVGWVESWRCKSSQHRKIVSLSPHVEKPLTSKRWIKVSYLNQFRVFGFLYMLMNILWTSCLFHISVSWVCHTGRRDWYPGTVNSLRSSRNFLLLLDLNNGGITISS